MDKIMNNSIESKNTSNDMPRGVGIFCGQPEVAKRKEGLILSVICVIGTIIFVWDSFATEPVERDDIILSAIFILITLSSVFFTVFSFTYLSRPKKKLIFEGVWFSKDKVWLGEHEIELQEKCSINNLMNIDCTNRIHANWIQTKRVSFMDIAETSMVLQIVGSNHGYNDYRIEKVYIFKGRKSLRYDFVSTPTVLINNGILYPCHKLTLIDQLKKIAKSIEPIQKNVNICNLVISPRSDTLEELTPMMENMGELNKPSQNEIKTHRTITTLQKGDFIDKENSDFLIKLMEYYGWKIEFC